jgi:hypothetical protein
LNRFFDPPNQEGLQTEASWFQRINVSALTDRTISECGC